MQRYILLLVLFILGSSSIHSQCTDPDPSIWKDHWKSCQESMNPKNEYGDSHWILYDLGFVRKLSKTRIWNANDPENLDLGFKQVQIDYSDDRDNWNHWGSMEFPKGTGTAIYGGFEGPDLVGVEARYVLITVLSNHGNSSCSGITEVKFNLMPNQSTVPMDEDEEDCEEEEEECDDEDCEEEEEFEECTIEEVILEEVLETEAFIYWESEHEGLYVFEIWHEDEFVEVEVEEAEIFLEDLSPGTTYGFRVGVLCEEVYFTDDMEFTTTGEEATCDPVVGIELEEYEDREALIVWEEVEDVEYYSVRYGRSTSSRRYELETEEPEIWLESIRRNRTYEVEIGYECEDSFIWSNPYRFSPNTNLLANSRASDLEIDQEPEVTAFPNPSSNIVTIEYDSPVSGILNFAIKDVHGRVFYRNVMNISEGVNSIQLQLQNAPAGICIWEGLELNTRKRSTEKIVKSQL